MEGNADSGTEAQRAGLLHPPPAHCRHLRLRPRRRNRYRLGLAGLAMWWFTYPAAHLLTCLHAAVGQLT